jgi:hypothetical protein
MKFEDLYNLNSFRRLKDSAQRFGDAANGVVLQRTLEAVDPTILKKKFPDLAFVNSGVEVSNIGGFSKRVRSLRTVTQGGYRNTGAEGANKGQISLKGEDSYIKVIEKMATGNWTETEIKEAEMQGINLVNDMLSAFNEIYLREIDEICLVGSTADGITEGLLNYSSFNVDTVATTAQGLSGANLYTEFADLINAQRNAVNNTPEYSCNVVLAPTDAYNEAQSKILNTAAGSSSVLKALQDNYPDVKFMHTFRGADSIVANLGEGNVTTSSTVAFSTSAQAIKARVPVPLQMSEIDRQGFSYMTEGLYRIGGIDVLEDTAGRILAGL